MKRGKKASFRDSCILSHLAHGGGNYASMGDYPPRRQVQGQGQGVSSHLEVRCEVVVVPA